VNRRQRMSNRQTARKLSDQITVCPECGQPGKHWVSLPFSLQNLIDGEEPFGFWICSEFYGPTGEREEKQA